MSEKLTIKANYSGFIEVCGNNNGTFTPFDGEVEIVLSGTKSNSLLSWLVRDIDTGRRIWLIWAI